MHRAIIIIITVGHIQNQANPLNKVIYFVTRKKMYVELASLGNCERKREIS